MYAAINEGLGDWDEVDGKKKRIFTFTFDSVLIFQSENGGPNRSHKKKKKEKDSKWRQESVL